MVSYEIELFELLLVKSKRAIISVAATRAIHSFSLYKKSAQERFALSLFAKRATSAICSFALYQKSESLILFNEKSKKAIKRDISLFSLFHSFVKEQKRELVLCALLAKSERAISLVRSFGKEQKSKAFLLLFW